MNNILEIAKMAAHAANDTNIELSNVTNNIKDYFPKLESHRKDFIDFSKRVSDKLSDSERNELIQLGDNIIKLENFYLDYFKSMMNTFNNHTERTRLSIETYQKVANQY